MKTNRRSCTPLLIRKGEDVQPKPIQFEQKANLNEEWIQSLIHDYPKVLPIAEIEDVFTPLISIGREIPTGAGYIDNLYISPRGYITICEAKLWHNPEARRQVVGQIIDYAKELTNWTFDDLDREVKNFFKKELGEERGIIQALKNYEPLDETDERDIIDNISRNLKLGRFLLLIVGDGIRESVEDMVGYLSQTPQLHFTLALVELQTFETDDDFLVVPQIVARTREITRAVVRVEGEKIIVTAEPEIDEEKTHRPRSSITEEEFYEQLRNISTPEETTFAKRVAKEGQERGYFMDRKSASLVFKLEDPGGSGRLITLFVIGRTNQVYLGWMAAQLKNLDLPTSIAEEFVRETAPLWNLKFKSSDVQLEYGWSKTISLGQFQKKYNEFMNILENTVDKIKKAATS